jgi:hypothetical protein
VSHEHELELAAAAIDFELTPDERRRLDAAIAECSECARAAAAYRRDATMLTALPVVDASPVIRRNVERAAGARPQRTSWTWVLLAAALLGLLLTSILVAGSYILRERDLARVERTPGPTPTTVTTPAPPSPPAPDVIALDPPSGELADVGPPLAHDAMAVVVTDDLRIRSAPFVGDLSLRYPRYLQRDDRLFVIDGPVIAQNYEWYQVKAWRPRLPTASWPVGWVARAGHDGEVWFRATAAGCPPEPLDITQVVALAPMQRVTCYGNTPVEIRAVVSATGRTDCDPTRVGCVTGPAILTGAPLLAGRSSSAGPAAAIPFVIDPAAGVSRADLATAGVVKLTGAFDHRDAATCEPDADRPGPDGPLSPIDAVIACRVVFVVTAAVVEPFPRLANVDVRTVSDRLRVRSLPEISDASIKYEPLLPLGSQVHVMEGPTLGNGYVWYHVTAAGGRADTVGHPISGWVAAAGKDGERWLGLESPAAS